MDDGASKAAATSLREPQTEFRADPAAHWVLIIVFAILALLSLTGIAWLMIKPGPVDAGRVLSALVLGVLTVAFVIGAGFYWLRLRRWVHLQESGLDYFDGRQTHEISWDDVREIYEVISSVKLLGITVDSPKLGVALVTREGVRCEVDQDIQGYQMLGPIISHEVNRNIVQRARRKLQRRQHVRFGSVSLSAEGILIEEPASPPWWEALKRRLDGHTQTCVTVPGEHRWQDIRAIQIAPAIHGSKWADHTTYNQVEIRIRGRESPVYVCPIPVFPNFAVFTEILNELNHPLTRADVQ